MFLSWKTQHVLVARPFYNSVHVNMFLSLLSLNWVCFVFINRIHKCFLSEILYGCPDFLCLGSFPSLSGFILLLEVYKIMSIYFNPFVVLPSYSMWSITSVWSISAARHNLLLPWKHLVRSRLGVPIIMYLFTSRSFYRYIFVLRQFSRSFLVWVKTHFGL